MGSYRGSFRLFSFRFFRIAFVVLSYVVVIKVLVLVTSSDWRQLNINNRDNRRELYPQKHSIESLNSNIDQNYSEFSLDELTHKHTKSGHEIILKKAPGEYKYLIKESNLCSNYIKKRLTYIKSNKGPYWINETHEDVSPDSPHLHAVIIVVSALRNWRERQNVRQTWGHLDIVLKTGIPVVFVVGTTSAPRGQHALVQESIKFRDIVQANFQDSYNNLTLKSLAGLSWSYKFCPEAQWTVKTDDDIAVNVFALKNYLTGIWSDSSGVQQKVIYHNVQEKHTEGNTRNVIERQSCSHQINNCILCDKLTVNARAHSGGKGTFVVSEDEWEPSTFPPYCHGVGYIFPTLSIGRVLAQTSSKKYIRAEDVFVTGILAGSADFVLHKMHHYSSYLNALQPNIIVDTFLNGTRVMLELDRDLERDTTSGPQLWSKLLSVYNVSVH